MAEPSEPVTRAFDQRRYENWLAERRVMDRAIRLYTIIGGFLIFVALVVGGAVFLLAYNQGHVRPRWAAAVLAVCASGITGGLGWLACRKVDQLEKERDQFDA
jgi:hypothetical protein